MPLCEMEIKGQKELVFAVNFSSFRGQVMAGLPVLGLPGECPEEFLKQLYPLDKDHLSLDNPLWLWGYAGGGFRRCPPGSVGDLLGLVQNYQVETAPKYLRSLFKEGIYVQYPSRHVEREVVNAEDWVWENFVRIGQEHVRVLALRQELSENRQVVVSSPSVFTYESRCLELRRLERLPLGVERVNQVALLSLYEVVRSLFDGGDDKYNIGRDYRETINFLQWCRQVANLESSMRQKGIVLPDTSGWTSY